MKNAFKWVQTNLVLVQFSGSWDSTISILITKWNDRLKTGNIEKVDSLHVPATKFIGKQQLV